VARQRWLSIKVELLSGRDLVLDHPAGRVMIASTGHTLAELAEAIDVAFARWDHSHLHEFKLGDGRRYMLGGSDFEPDVLDSTGVTLASLHLGLGMSFEYVFDLGDDWRHRCEVQSVDADPGEEYGTSPDRPVPTWGWGWIPDQYGRVREDE
jgi:Plasmid pRiA4b ORF-3-like protein